MFQNWLGVYQFVKEHQNNILRQAERARQAEALRRSRGRRHARAGDEATAAPPSSATRGCKDETGHPATEAPCPDRGQARLSA
jgi:hypothetical protein